MWELASDQESDYICYTDSLPICPSTVKQGIFYTKGDSVVWKQTVFPLHAY